MRKWLLWVLLVLLVVPSVAYTEDITLTVNQKNDDLQHLSSELEEKHYDLHALVEKTVWDERVETLRQKSADMSDMDFALSIMQLVASIGDSHTRAGLTGSIKEKLGALPLQLMWFENNLHLIACTKEYESYLGQKLVKVGEPSIGEVMETFRGFISYDNETWFRKQFAEYLIGVEYLAFLGAIDSTEQVLLVFENSAGELHEVQVKAEYGELYNLEFVTVQREAVPLAQQAASIYYTTELSDHALMISYHSCQEDPNLPMDVFIEQVKNQLVEKKYSKVLVDLRYNGGGNSAIFEPVISMLGEEKESMGFDLYAMIGENTFSSALMNAVQIKMRAGAILVGQSTGGSVNHYGEIVNFELPHAEVIVTYSTKFFNMVPDYGKGSLEPDVYIHTTFDEFIKGQDPEVECILSAK